MTIHILQILLISRHITSLLQLLAGLGKKVPARRKVFLKRRLRVTAVSSGMVISGSVLSFLLLTQGAGQAAPAQKPVELPAGSPLWVKLDKTIPLHVGQLVEGRLQYGIYAGNALVLPPGTLVQGAIVGLQPEHSHRIQARLRGDFTPFSKPVVQFNDAVVHGAPIPLSLTPASDGAPVLQLTPPPPRKGGFIRHEFDQGVQMVKDRVHLITGPGKKERLKQLLYSQLPYHPQNVPAGTVWTVDTTAPVELATVPLPSAPEHKPLPGPASVVAAATTPPASPAWTVQAYLSETLSSSKAKVGEPIRAIVAQPVLDATGAVAVPEGAVLQGEVTHARPARRFGRAGELRFDFRQLTFPGSDTPEAVQTNLAGIDATGDANLSIDSEGQVQPKPKDKVVVPALLLLLAARPLDRDRGDGSGGAFGKDAVGSNSLGVVGFIIGTAGGWRNVAAGIGYYGSAIAIWNRWIKRGDETTLRRDTRVVVQTTPRRSERLTSSSTELPHGAGR